MLTNLVRWSGLAAMLGGVLGVLLSPVLAHLWDTYSDAYRTYGKVYFLSLPPELWGLYTLRKVRGGSLGTLERWGFRLMQVGMWLALLGVFTDYWVEVPPGYLWVIIATPFLVAGYVLLGLGLWRASAVPLRVILIMAGAAVVTVPVMFFVLYHVPSGPLLTLHLVWIALGYALFSCSVASAPGDLHGGAQHRSAPGGG